MIKNMHNLFSYFSKYKSAKINNCLYVEVDILK